MRFEGVFTGGTASELTSTRHLSSKSVRERVLGKWHVICFISCQGWGLFPEQFIVGLRFYVDRGVLPADLSRTENCKYVIAAFSCFYAATSLACTSNLAQTEDWLGSLIMPGYFQFFLPDLWVGYIGKTLLQSLLSCVLIEDILKWFSEALQLR